MKQVITRAVSLLLALQSFSANVFAQAKPGDISANVKYIDADEIFSFSEGVAVVKKGLSTALIDTNGNFIVPYNMYQFRDNDIYRAKQGLVIASDGKTFNSGSPVLLNLQGKKLYTSHASFQEPRDGYAQTLEGKTYVFVNAQGNIIKVSDLQKWKNLQASTANEFSEGLAQFSYVDPKYPVNDRHEIYGYIDRTYKTIVNPVYDFAGDFSEGLALVGKFDEFKKMKYGFINPTGTVVIPLMYSKMPGKFREGLAVIEPVDTSEFCFAFINKKNEIVLKIKNLPEGTVEDHRPDNFLNGYSALLGGKYYIDKAGKIIDMRQWKRLHPKKFEGVFDRYYETDIDPVSQFNIAEKEINGKTVKGYVNGNGVFKIIIKQQTF